MSDLIMVTGSDCLDYIDRPIGFGSHDFISYGNMTTDKVLQKNFLGVAGSELSQFEGHLYFAPNMVTTILFNWSHDVNKRVVGLVLGESPDGGLEVALLGDESIVNSVNNGNMFFYAEQLNISGDYAYAPPALPDIPEWKLATERVGGFPQYRTGNPQVFLTVRDNMSNVPFDQAMDYDPTDETYGSSDGYTVPAPFGVIWEFAGQYTVEGGRYTLTNDKNNTMVFGKILDLYDYYTYPTVCMENPLNLLGGNLYNAMSTMVYYEETIIPERLPANTDWAITHFEYPQGTPINRTNMTALPFNLILTRSEMEAKNYLTTGALPSDAFLYPLDWDNLPRYDEGVPTGDAPDDYDDDNDPDDITRDFDSNLPETPSYTVNQFTNYNWYWLTVPEWSEFIRWFWNDIGAYNDFDDIIAKIEGLYNDVASAVIMCRYYPVDPSWIGGLGNQETIKLGMIQKQYGTYDTINQNTPLTAQDIGTVHVSRKYKSFMDMSPYSQLSLYLPWHGFIDIDNDLFTGHDLTVKALYDYLSGTIQYYIYYDNSLLVNTIICKMAMDIPITLQTKNDRDSAIFNNVSSTVGGLIGAGAGVVSGNPIGIALGVTQGVGALNNSNNSAPMRFMGNVGESGGYIAPQNCYLIIRRPTIQPSDGNSQSVKKALKTWKHNVGMVCGYGYTLSDLEDCGFTMCHTPRIDFKNTTPLQTEVDEIYSYLEKGVIL